MKIGITGIRGRMAKALAFEIINNPLLEISSALVREGYDEVGADIGEFLGLEKTGTYVTDSLETFVSISEVIIDFSAPELLMKVAPMVAEKGKKLVTGTTGLSDAELEKLKKYSEECGMVQSYNMSIGANLLFNLSEEAAALLRSEYDTEILEMHHRGKKDAPSGTAIALGKAIAKGKGLDFNAVAKKSREGMIGVRPDDEIGFATLRGGDVVGEHTVIFAGLGERIELSHKATSRIIFVNGAIRAAIWLSGQGNGFYSMQDVLRVK